MTPTEVQPVPSAEGSAAPEPSAPSNIVELPDGNRVTLHPKVTPQLGIAMASIFTSGQPAYVVEASLAEVYRRYAIESWTFRDAKDRIEALTPDNVDRLLPYGEAAVKVHETANSLYATEVMLPLLLRLPPSRPSPTDTSTSQTPNSGTSSPTPSTPSSPESSADGTGSEVPVP